MDEKKLAAVVGAHAASPAAPALRGGSTDSNFLLSTMDAKVWADEFVRLNSASDHATMLGWFACAIMTGFDEATRRATPAAAQQPTAWKAFTDVQWMNIVNHDRAWESHDKESAVHEAVKMTEAKCREVNFLAAQQPAIPEGYALAMDAAWNAYQNAPVDLCGDHDAERRKCVESAVTAAFAAARVPLPVRQEPTK